MKKLILITSLIFYSSAWGSWIDISSELIFHKKEARLITTYQKVPITWWNFFFYDNSLSRQEVCAAFQSIPEDWILYSPCRNLGMDKQWLESWAKDNLMRTAPPKKISEWESQLNKALVRLSLPLPPELLDLQRLHPLTDYSYLKKSMASFYEANESQNSITLLPVLFNYSPKELDKTRAIENSLQDSSVSLTYAGPHFGTLRNQQQIVDDLKLILGFGSLLLLALIGFLFITRKKLFLALLPMMGLSVGFATLVVLFFWGSIHGLTLAFGSGLIGISMDYAFHGWPQKHRSEIWKSNFVSYLTTVIAFSLLLFFSIPLIQQISLFAITGLSFSFVLTYVLSKTTSDKFRPQEFLISAKVILKPKQVFIFLTVLMFALLTSLSVLNSDFSLKRLDATQSKDAPLLKSTGQDKRNQQYAFVLGPQLSPKDNEALIQWSKDFQLQSMGPSSISVKDKAYKAHKEQWITFVCGTPFKSWKQTSGKKFKIFEEFINSLDCERFKNDLSQSKKSYLKIFESNNEYLTIFKASTRSQIELIKKNFPDVFFLKDITEKFPRKVKSEIQLFMLIAALTTFLILALFFRKTGILSIIPFFGAMSHILLAHALFQWPFSFISFITLIILMGLTLDYGIFCTSCYLNKSSWPATLGSISLSAMTSLAGFAPLAISSHPVLRDMGLTIALGVCGALISSFLIYPSLGAHKK